jgi:hypothetical protein
MGLLDDVLGSAVPGGNLAKPLMIAATALLAARATGAAANFANFARVGPRVRIRLPPAASLSLALIRFHRSRIPAFRAVVRG